MIKTLLALIFFLIFYLDSWADSVDIYSENLIIISDSTTVQMPIFIDDASGLDIFSYYFVLFFDENVIVSTGFDADSTLSEDGITLINFDMENQLSLTWFSTTPLDGAGILIKLNFEILGTVGDSTALSFNQFLFNEGNPTAIYATPLALIKIVSDIYYFDLNKDDILDVRDLQILSSFYGTSSEICDFNDDGIVDFFDFRYMINQMKNSNYNY